MVSRKSGDAKWHHKHVSVIPGETYNFSSYYQSDVQTNMTLEYKLLSGSYLYVGIGTLPASVSWKHYTTTFAPPADAVSVSVLHLIKKIGYLHTDNYTLNLASI